ncbi:RidA family protein [Isachenkonia alkalipeptolytica]|uniref:RidA family protein n=1 Tax=Isachenkonia alkalipeptolytica TaxID=2565777 RepID=A0AA43XKF3_9CLOT|nr:Rid family detoxifying hydrolase [Isachenkonia alkalipeptolytica]NBG87879.1 RidA family protein [Isachenkonia alkalipeptolytica]
MARKAFNAKEAVAVGPYSHAVEAGGFLYLSGQTPIDSTTGKLVEGDITDQTEQCFNNLMHVLASADLTSDAVIKVKVFLTDMENFHGMNSVYEKQFSKPFPARTTIGVKELPLGAQVEIEMVARRA